MYGLIWISGEILDLLHERETIQKDLRPSNTPAAVAKNSKKFTQPNARGKCLKCNETID